MKTTAPVLRLALALLLAFALSPASRAQSAAYGSDRGSATPEEGGSYSYIRVVEGSATLTQGGSETRSQAEVNLPVLAGDRLSVSPGSRIELVLSDRNVLRLDGGTEIAFDALAGSPEGRDPSTVLRLFDGNLQLVVYGDALGERLPRIDSGNATVYVQDYGTYRVTAERDLWTGVVVRRGYAEVATDQGSVVVRADEEATIEGGLSPRATVRAASREDDLERWGFRLEEEARRADRGGLGDDLAYSASSLDRYGSWVEVGSRRAWRPRVDASWRPFWFGRWIYTPSGLIWVSYEPWGWVPYHYGAWDFDPSFGWVWFPGHAFSPAWVYWYWGPTYVGWVPVGYYTRYYSPRFHGGFSFHFGVYGWAGGRFDVFDRWTFCPLRDFGHGDHRRFFAARSRPGHGDSGVLPRGLITTDTRGLTPSRWDRPDEARRVLLRTADAEPGGRRVAVPRGAGGAALPDATPFVARRPALPADLERRVADRAPRPDDRVPFVPGVSDGRGYAGRRPARPDAPPARIARPAPEGRPDLVRERPPVDRSPGLERRPPTPGYRLPERNGGRTGLEVIRRPAGDARPGSAGGSRDRSPEASPAPRRPIERPAARPGGSRPELDRRPAPEPRRPTALRPERVPPVRRVLEGVRGGSARGGERRVSPSSPRRPPERRVGTSRPSGSSRQGRGATARPRSSGGRAGAAHRSTGSSRSGRSAARPRGRARSRGGHGGG